MKIQCTIAGFSGQPSTIIGNLDENTGVLVMVKEVTYREERIAPDFALVSNLDLKELDFRFDDKHLSDAIRSFYTRKAQMTLDIMTGLQRYDPESRIEREAVDESGRRYRVAPDIQNGQVAILAAVSLVEHSGNFSAAKEMADELIDLYRVQSF